MAKKSQSEISKAIDKANKLARKGKYAEAVKVLRPYQSDSGARKIMNATEKLGKSVKELKSDPLHKRFRWRAKRDGNKVTLVAEEKRGCWPFRF
jgi:hypothetical protein